jgi:hypothetical protein
MLEQKEYRGQFYLPENPDKKISGVLYFYPNNTIRLELLGGCLSGKTCGPFCKHDKIGVIWGVIKEEHSVNNVTLLSCYGSGGKSWNMRQNNEVCTANYVCSHLLLGKHLTDIEDKIFNKIRVSFPLFNDWYKENHIEFDCLADWTAIHKTTFEPNTTPRKFKLNEKKTLIINGYSGHYHIDQHRKCLYEESYVELETSEKSSLIDLLMNAGWFRDLYSFAAMTAMPFSEIYLYDDTANIRYPLFYVEETTFEKKDKFVPYRFLFDFDKIESKFGTIVKLWYDKKDSSEPIIQQLISSVTPRRFIKSSDFLSVVQAIEGYYNRFKGDNVSLRDILTRLYDAYKDISIIVNNKPDINQVVDSRHYYSHILPEGKKENVRKGFELFGLTEKLKPLLVGCILTLIGFTNGEIDELLQDYDTWKGSFLIKTE